MFARLQPFFSFIGAAGLLVIAFLLLSEQIETAREPMSFTRPQETEILPVFASSTPEALVVEEPVQESVPIAETTPEKPAQATTEQTTSENSSFAVRTENPYPFVKKSLATLDTEARSALVNIFCESGERNIPSTSGSGVIIDSKGVILTNAHVAQYFLLDERPDISLSCVIRTGAPAKPRYDAKLLFFPEAWIDAHGADIGKEHTSGTGENDYALLLITKSLDSSPLPAQFPYLPFDTREAIAFTGDTLLVASYPAEFISGQATKSSLYPATVATIVGDLRTFKATLVDVISLGGIFVAQGGSSGGATVNEWGRLVGIISTTSDGETTADRDLRAVTLAHIDRSVNAFTGVGLSDFLSQDVSSKTEQFGKTKVPTLAERLVTALQSR